MGKAKRTNRPKWGTTDPRPINQRRPQIDPVTGLPPVGKGLPGERDRAIAQAREKHRHRPIGSRP